MKVFYFLIIAIASFTISCKKKEIQVVDQLEEPPIDNEPDPDPEPIVEYDTIYVDNNIGDTIYPSDYLMAYPGSWWKYSNGHEYQCTGWDEVTYFQKSINGTTVTITTENYILPKLSNVGYIKDKSFLSTSNFITTARKLVGDFVGEQLQYSQTSVGSYPNSSTNTQNNIYAAHHDELFINGQIFEDVIEIQENYNVVYTYTGAGPYGYVTKYYAKNIGLVKIVSEGLYTNQINMEITDFFIAPH